MRIRMACAGLALTIVSTAVTTGWGADLRLVPAGTKWLMEINVKAMIESETGRFLSDNAPTQLPAMERIKAFVAMTGVDFAKDVSSITVCGEDVGKNGAIAILHGSWNVDKLSAILPLAKNFTSRKHGEYTVMSWEDRSPRFACFVSKELAFFTSSEERLLLALDTRDGRKPNLSANTAFADFNPVAKKPFVTLQAVGVNALAGGQRQAAALQQTEALRFVIEQVPATKAVAVNVELTAVSAETADQMARMLLGMQAMAQMQGANNPEFFELVNTFKITSAGPKVSMGSTLQHDLLKRLMDSMMRMREGRAAGGGPVPAVPPAFE